MMRDTEWKRDDEAEGRQQKEHMRIGEVKGFLKMNESEKDERNISTENYQ